MIGALAIGPQPGVLASGAAVAPTLGTLTLSGALTNGTPSTGTIIGATAGSTIVSNVTGLTVNSAARTYSWDGTGTAGTTANGLVETLAGAIGSPYPSPITVVVATYVGPVSNNTVLPTSLLASGQMEQSTIHTTNAGMSDIQLVFPQWYVTGTYNQETPIPTSYTVQAAVEYPVNSGNWTQITSSGVNTGTVPVWSGTGSGNFYTDRVAVVIPAAGQFRLFYYMVGANLPQLSNTAGKVLATDEGSNSSATANATPKNVADNDSGPRRFRRGPVAILGTRSGDSAAVVGDSQVAYISSTYTTADDVPPSHNRGDIPNTIGGTFDYLNIGIGGDAWSTALWTSVNRIELARKATIVIDEFGINEFNVKQQTTAPVPLAIKARAAPFFSGKKLIYTTLTPRTTGAWTTADGSDQTLAAYSTAIPTYNSGATVNGAVALDRFSVLQNTTTVNKWIANGTVAYATRDGLHLSTISAYTLMAVNASAWATQLNALTAATFTQPPMDFTGSGTFSGGYLVNGTLAHTTGAPGLGVQTLIMRIKVAVTQVSQLIFSPNNSNPWIKTIQVTAAGLISVQNPAGTIYATSSLVRDGAEHELAVVDDGTTQTAYLDGVSFGSATYAHTASEGLGGVSIVASSAATTAVSIREVTVWNKAVYTANYTPVLFNGNEPGLIALWHLATSNTAILGPVLPQ